MANRNRTAGHNYERKIRNELSEFYPDVVTARSESRNKDNKGIDIFDLSEDMPFDIQCKVSKGLSSNKINDLLNAGDELPMVIAHKHVKKADKIFTAQGELIYMK